MTVYSSSTAGALQDQELRDDELDVVSGGWCELVVPVGGKVYPQEGEPKIGIAHPRCISVADLAIDFDAFFCPTCKRSGRVSGAWAADIIRNARDS